MKIKILFEVDLEIHLVHFKIQLFETSEMKLKSDVCDHFNCRIFIKNIFVNIFKL